MDPKFGQCKGSSVTQVFPSTHTVERELIPTSCSLTFQNIWWYARPDLPQKYVKNVVRGYFKIIISLYSKFKANLGYMRPVSKKQNQTNIKTKTEAKVFSRHKTKSK